MRILIIDSSYLIYKSYFAFKGRHLKIERDGQEINTSAIFGFIREIIHLKTEGKYDFIIAVNDYPPYLKKNIDEEYKKRPDKKISVPSFDDEKVLIQAILYDLGIPCYFSKGYEGEEIAKALMKKYKNKHQIEFYTNDEDCYALIDDNVTLVKTDKGEIIKFGKENLQQKYNVTPKQFVHMKALTGCKSDNVTSIIGVGPVTASKLINEYGTIRNIIKNLDNVSSNLKTKIKEAIDNGNLNKSIKLTRMEIPNELQTYKPEIQLKYNDIFEYIDAQTFLKGTSQVVLMNIQKSQKKNKL
jgi:DNA polymerase-1